MKDQSPAYRNIKTICAIEHAAMAQRSAASRFSDFIVSQAGKTWFVVFHAVWFSLWIGDNLIAPKARAFDPYPFALLTMIVSLESIFLSLFIIMSQNRSSLIAEQRNHLDLQINLLAEDENTKMLQMLQALCEHHGLSISRDPEVQAFARRTELTDVIEELKDNLPGNE